MGAAARGQRKRLRIGLRVAAQAGFDQGLHGRAQPGARVAPFGGQAARGFVGHDGLLGLHQALQRIGQHQRGELRAGRRAQDLRMRERLGAVGFDGMPFVREADA
ncbi:Uncharacterised protein [Bordetella pertussis]|nr:Uncharacterised protein [Bordetella pertussis]CFO72894.1 Uncharacterised protein [Bordetella pertussis]CFP55951.1 Uncharacterised protein [Bordetella pertussis]CFW48766.1 Uncharacterised protein [Bordetella pertussis]CPK04118.1 Uncharacterised protein [Bordetella pertussis]